MQPLASGSHFSAASIIFSSCRSPKQLPPKPTKAILAANVYAPVEGKRGETSKRLSSLRHASSILCIFPRSANHSLHGPCRVRLSFRSGKATGRGLLIGSREGLSFSRREEAFTTAAVELFSELGIVSCEVDSDCLSDALDEKRTCLSAYQFFVQPFHQPVQIGISKC